MVEGHGGKALHQGVVLEIVPVCAGHTAIADYIVVTAVVVVVVHFLI